MLDIFLKNDRSDDVRMRWADTIIGLVNDKEITPFMTTKDINISEAKERYIFNGYILKDKSWEPYSLDTSKEKNIVPYPTTGYINSTDKSILQIFRNNHTTTKKGYVVGTYRRIGGVSKGTRISNLYVYDAYNPKYYDIDTCVNSILNKDYYSRAVSPTIGLSITYNLKDLVIYRGSYAVGIFDFKNKLAQIPSKLSYLKAELNEVGFDSIEEVNYARKNK